MHQNVDDDDWTIANPPQWIGRLADNLDNHVAGGWSSDDHRNNALAFLGMLEIEIILDPVLRAAIGPIHVFWPKGNNERLEVVIKSSNCCHVTRKYGEFTKEEFDCTPIGLRAKLLEYYPFVRNNFDRKFHWTGMI